jgi:ATP:ADP antiporter, AAA family
MALNIAKALNIEKKEQSVVFLLLIQSVFLGIFAGALDVGANSLFLEKYSADLIPQAFTLSGIVGIIFTSVYAFLQKRIPFKTFTVINLFIAIACTAALRFGFTYIEADWLAFAVFVMMGPLIIISLLGFWGTAGRYFTLREGKRLFGIIDTGAVVGMILAFYAVPVLMQFNFMVYNTLMIGLVSLVAALLFQIILIRRHKFLSVAKKGSAEPKKKSGFFSLFKKRYTSMMALFVVMSVITAFFVHYSFMWATEANYTDVETGITNNKELTGFIGAFFGTMMIFTVVIKSTLYGWLMKNYGLRVALLISPALLLILTVVAALVGGIFGYTAEAASFTLFFMVISLSKLFNKSLKDAIESPSMKILYQSLDSEERYDVQARIDGIVNELTAFTAGLLMAGLLMLSFVKVIHFSYILIAILVLWVFLGVWLYRSYRKTLNDSLASARSSVDSSEEEQERELPKISEIKNYTEMIKLNPYFYHIVSDRDMDGMLENSNIDIQMLGWEMISDTLYSLNVSEVDKIKSKTKNKELLALIEHYLRRNHLANKDIDAAFRSADKNEIFAALVQTAVRKEIDYVPHIITLLRDRDVILRSAAIETAGIMNVRELGGYLVDYLGNPELYAITWSSLVRMGEGILENLENAFYKTGAPLKVQQRIVSAMIAIGGEKANEYLFTKINYHNRTIREAAIAGLYIKGFEATESQVPLLQSAIYEAALAGAWNMSAEFVVQENNPENGLLDAIVEEMQQTNELLFMLLAITYDRHAIDHVMNSLMDVENEDTGFAIELLNLIVDDQVYAYLEPYFEQMAIPDKVRKLQNEMPVEILPYKTLLTDLISRDGLYTGNYIRLCAINAIGMHNELDASLELAAQIFNPNEILSESANIVLSLKNAELYNEITARFPEERIETARLNDKEKGMHLLMIIADAMKKWTSFSSVKLETLFLFSREFVTSTEHDFENEELVTLIQSQKTNAPDSLKFGQVVISTEHPELYGQFEEIAKQKGISIYQIDKNKLRELLFDHEDLLEAFTSMCMNDSIEIPTIKQAD